MVGAFHVAPQGSGRNYEHSRTIVIHMDCQIACAWAAMLQMTRALLSAPYTRQYDRNQRYRMVRTSRYSAHWQFAAHSGA
jgi:hypothetical protein